MIRATTGMLLAATVLASAGMAHAADVTLTIESWRNDDLAIWQEKLIPAFQAKNPGIKLVFSPTAPTEYNASLNAKLDAGSAGDIITCRPFDASLELFNKKQLVDLTGLSGMSNFSPVAKAAWSTDDGKSTFCVPMASVIHGFIYNKDAFEKLGIAVPKTNDEFYAALDKIKKDGTYIPLAMGTKDLWEAATMGYQNIGPNYWKGEEGRAALIAGKQKLTDPEWVKPFEELAKWKPYLGDGFEAQTYSARTSSRSAAPPSIRLARGRFRSSTPRPSSRWAPSRRRFRRLVTPATSPTIRISASPSMPRAPTRKKQRLS
jgi:raffinose/stachyose/melibiose transport system substrate-binding protein